MEEDTYVRVTLRDVYQELRKVSDVVTGLALDSSRVDDHETRIRTVERRVWALPSLATIIALASLAVAILTVIAPR